MLRPSFPLVRLYSLLYTVHVLASLPYRAPLFPALYSTCSGLPSLSCSSIPCSIQCMFWPPFPLVLLYSLLYTVHVLASLPSRAPLFPGVQVKEYGGSCPVSQEDREAEYRGFNPFNIQIYRDRRHRAENCSSVGMFSLR